MSSGVQGDPKFYHFSQIGPFWHKYSHFGTNLPILAQICTFWPKFVICNPILVYCPVVVMWPHMGPFRPHWEALWTSTVIYSGFWWNHHGWNHFHSIKFAWGFQKYIILKMLGEFFCLEPLVIFFLEPLYLKDLEVPKAPDVDQYGYGHLHSTGFNLRIPKSV